ncbi:MAG: HD domain-containing protein [Planctomycetota bacterium]|nr:HD domain-containing protein [Planctomycetota bacterium]
MIVNPQVPLHRLILSLSEALDHVHPHVVDHQHRVAYIATSMGRHMGLKGTDLLNVFNAAELHDIGIIGLENRVRALRWGQLESVRWHAEVGYELLRDNPLFADAARCIRHHHTPWADGRGAESDGEAVPMAAHLLVLADAVERMIDRDVPVLQQIAFIKEKVHSLSGEQFHPDCVEAFRDVSGIEAFWLDIACQRIYGVLLRQMDWPVLSVDENGLGLIARVFARVVDAASRWTAVHSAGVTATAGALAKQLSFSPRELCQMRAAGYLHDLGKLSVQTEILDKPNRLNDNEMAVVRGHTYHTFRILDTVGGMPQISEWAAFHHERLDGKGYPFHHTGESLTLGSRIMAVADVFTAVAEDRPYRPGMTAAEAFGVIGRLVTSGGLDGDVVATLRRDYDTIDAARRKEQAEYAEMQKRLSWLMRERAGVPVG